MPSLSIISPQLGGFVTVDTGGISQETLLLNILIELRVISQILQTQSTGLFADDLNGLRLDQVNDPASLNKT